MQASYTVLETSALKAFLAERGEKEKQEETEERGENKRSV